MAGPWAGRRWVASASAASVIAAMTLASPAYAQGSVNTSPPTISGQTAAGATLTASSGSWTDGSLGSTFNYSWQRCTSSTSCTTVITHIGTFGEFSDSYQLSSADVGFAIRVVVVEVELDGTQSDPASSALTSVVTETGAPVIDATALADRLAGPGVTVSSATYEGASAAVGPFSGDQASIGVDAGVGISTGLLAGGTGCAKGVEGPNACAGNSTNFGLRGLAELSALAGHSTYDGARLSIDFVPTYSTLSFQYVFGSEEYDEYANSNYNDVFAFDVNGTNCALVPGTSEPVSVDTINNGDPTGDTTPHHPDLFRDNTDGHLDTELDGLTTVLTCRATVNPGQQNSLTLEIADSSDAIFDSAVFVAAGTIESSETTVATHLTAAGTSGDAITVPVGTAVVDQADLSGANAPAASGTVTYTVYSDGACTDAIADAGTRPVTAGVVAASDPVSLNDPGTYHWQAHYSGDAANNAADSPCASEIETVVRDAVSLTYTGTATGTYSQPATLSARLVDTSTGQPLHGRIVSFTVGTGATAQTVSSSPTDNNGNAVAVVPQLASGAPTAPLALTYSGDSTTQAATGSATLTIAADSCTLTYTGTTTVTGPTITLAATLADGDAPTGQLGGHTVTFSIVDATGATTTYTATTGSDGAASISVAAPQAAVTVTASVSDNYYGPCASTPTMVGTHSGTTLVLGAGTALAGHHPLQFALTLFNFRGSYHTAIGVNIDCRAVFRGVTVTSVAAVSGNDVRWSGRGLWGFGTPVTYDIEAVAGNDVRHTPGQLGLTVRSSSGAVLFTTNGLIPLKAGHIVIR